MASFVYGLELTLTELVALAQSDGIELPGYYQTDLDQLTYPEGFSLIFKLERLGFVEALEVVFLSCQKIYLGVKVTRDEMPKLIDQWPAFLDKVRLELRVCLDINASKEQLMRIMAKTDKILQYYHIPYCARCQA